MTTSTVRVHDNTAALLALMRERTLRALDEAAAAGKAVFDAQAEGITEASLVPARPTDVGYEAGIRARNPIYRVFDHGSLDKRNKALKRPNLRKTDWPVKQRRRSYTAHRGDVTGKGLSPRNISNPARLAGRKALIEALHI